MPAPIQLSADEARVIGALIEKELSTPDQYPLSVNALVNACNQKNNRDPIVSISEASVLTVLETLTRRRLVMSESGSRVR